jgi:hypothetical protein
VGFSAALSRRVIQSVAPPSLYRIDHFPFDDVREQHVPRPARAAGSQRVARRLVGTQTPPWAADISCWDSHGLPSGGKFRKRAPAILVVERQNVVRSRLSFVAVSGVAATHCARFVVTGQQALTCGRLPCANVTVSLNGGLLGVFPCTASGHRAVPEVMASLRNGDRMASRVD